MCRVETLEEAGAVTGRGSLLPQADPRAVCIRYLELSPSKMLLGPENTDLYSDEKKDLTAVGERASCYFSPFNQQIFMFLISEEVSS